MSVRQKLDDFSNKVVQELTLEKMFLTKNGPLNFLKKLKSKVDFESTILALFVKLSFIDRIFLIFFL